MNNNPFYNIPYHPQFDRMTPESAESALLVLLEESSAAVDKLESEFESTWDALVQALHDAVKDLFDAWGLLNHMLSVMNSDEWRQVQERIQPDIIRFAQRIGQSRRFYEGYKLVRENQQELGPVKLRILNKTIQGAEQSGVALEAEQKDKFNAIQMKLAQISTKFSNNLLDARSAYSLTLTSAEEVAGLPADLLAITSAAACEDGTEEATAEEGPWKITLDYAVYAPFMKHSRNRAAREQLYRAHVTLASGGVSDNEPLVSEILEHKQDIARLLGYSNAAELSLSNKMAPNTEAVYALFDELCAASSATLKQEQTQLLDFARANGFSEETLQPWDSSFWAERQREHLYDYSEEEVSRYFQFPRVLQGMFDLVERIFKIRITEARNAVPVWHEDVRFFRVNDADDTPLACFYLDPYSRPKTKRSGAWMNEFRTREKKQNSITLPMAVMCCNQSVPIGAQPSLMRMGEVTTLFHEFGHALQHMLTHVDEPQASGINGIEWDAVEIASQFMENWCYDRKTLQSISMHIETGKPLPDELFKKIVAAKNYLSATAMMRQLFLGATDMDLYAKYPDPQWRTPDDVKRSNAKKYHYPLIDEDRFLCSFAHIFGGGYSAGYFSYKWSEVLSADCFAAFEEAGMEDDSAIQATGLKMRATIMGEGGGKPPMEVFKSFRNREPDTDALLRHCGLK